MPGMYILTLASLTAIALAGPVARDTLPKANEYASGDCSGDLNYGHHSSWLGDVTMDDSSHSVYLAGGQWLGFTEKSGNGGSCYGDVVPVAGACNNLDSRPGFSGGDSRIKCVRKTG